MKIRIILLAIAAVAVAACHPTPDPGQRKFLVPAEANISIAVGADGSVELKVTVPPGDPFAGTYMTTSQYLLDDFRDAQANRGKPGTAVWITVDEANQILAMTNQTTMQ